MIDAMTDAMTDATTAASGGTIAPVDRPRRRLHRRHAPWLP
jgi:hypothetical protein